MEENYKNGVRHGKRIIYSKNGELKKGMLERIIKKLK